MRGLFCLVCFSVMIISANAETKRTYFWSQYDRLFYCADGEFDAESGQSLYDFIVSPEAKDPATGEERFLMSYLGIPFPSWQTRDYFHIFLKVRGSFRAEREAQGKTLIYRLFFDYLDSTLGLHGKPDRFLRENNKKIETTKKRVRAIGELKITRNRYHYVETNSDNGEIVHEQKGECWYPEKGTEE